MLRIRAATLISIAAPLQAAAARVAKIPVRRVDST